MYSRAYDEAIPNDGVPQNYSGYAVKTEGVEHIESIQEDERHESGRINDRLLPLLVLMLTESESEQNTLLLAALMMGGIL